MSQVKNLRAMFEHKGPSSPPERGREGASGLGDSPRPLSRVRTNFVTVEKDGRVGLHRDTSCDSIPTLSRTMSAGTEGDLPTPPTSLAGQPEVKDKLDDRVHTPTPVQLPAGIAEEAARKALKGPLSPKKVATPLVNVVKPAAEPAPAFALPVVVTAAPAASRPSTPPAETTAKGTVSKTATPAASPEKALARKLFAQQPSNTAEAEKTKSTALKDSADAPTNGSRGRLPHAQTGAANGAVKPKTDAPKADTPKADKAAPTHAAASAIPMRSKIPSAQSAPKEQKEQKEHKENKEPSKTATKTKSLPKAIATTKTAPKTASVTKVKTPTSPTKPKLAAAKQTADKKTHTAAVSEKKSTPPTSAPKAAGSKKPSNIQTFPPNGAGFVKPKPKSPTRPVQLPPSLTTHTASSATKTRQTPSGQSGSFLAVHGASQASATRSHSRASVATTGTAAAPNTKAKTLRRQLSSVGRQRPSIGPPPKQPARDHPVIKKDKVIDEGFLERLMRPTQSFTCKTADKVHQSPPRSNKSRESFGSSRSTTSVARSVKEKAPPIPKTLTTFEAPAGAAKPVIAAPVKDAAAAAQPAAKDVEETVNVAETKVADEAAVVNEAAESEAAAKTTENAAEVVVSEEVPPAVAEEAAEEVTKDEAAEDVAVEDDKADEVADTKVDEEKAVEADTAVEVDEKTVEANTSEETVDDKVGEEAIAVPAAEEKTAVEDATPEVTPEPAAEAAKDVTHVDVAATEEPAAAAEL